MLEILYTKSLEDFTKEDIHTVKNEAYSLYNEFIKQYEQQEVINVTALETFLIIMDDIYREGKHTTPLSDEEYDTLHSIYIDQTGHMIRQESHMEKVNEQSKLAHEYPQLKGTMEKVHYITKEERLADPNAIATHKSIMEWFESRMEKIKEMKRDPKEEIIISFFPKYDGVSIQLSLDESGKVTKAITRGDTDTGIGIDRTALFENVSMLNFIPHEYRGRKLGMKVECIMKMDVFEEYNEKFGDNKLINERSAVTSLTNSNTFTDVHAKYLSICPLMLEVDGKLVSYHCKSGEGAAMCPPFEFMNYYVKSGEFTSEYLPTYIRNGAMFIDNLPYQCDGIVIRFVQQDIMDYLGRNENKGTNNFEVAYKFPKPSNYTTLLDIEQDIGLMGKVSFTAKVEPFVFNNKTIKSVSLGSYDRFKELKLAKGDMVNVKYEIIPYLLIDKVCEDHRSGNEPIPVITHCPYCGEELEFNPEYMCVNTSCPSRVIGKIYNYCSKMGMEMIGEATIETLYHHGLVTSIQDLYTLHTKRDEFTSIDGLGDIMFSNMIEAINSASAPIDVIIGSIGIPGVGRKIFKKVLDIYHIDELLQLTPSDKSILCTVPGIKDTMAMRIINGITENRALIMFLLDTVTITDMKETEAVVVFTGFRNKLFEDYLNTKGVEVASSVTSKTNLVIADNPNKVSGKVAKAQQLGIPVIGVFDAYEKFGYKGSK